MSQVGFAQLYGAGGIGGGTSVIVAQEADDNKEAEEKLGDDALEQI